MDTAINVTTATNGATKAFATENKIHLYVFSFLNKKIIKIFRNDKLNQQSTFIISVFS